jgi:undecaprenyl-phosphate 4-deoxy-4-formamido-L-arabinose transferase
VIVTLDDDLQNPPEEIPKLLDALNGGHDVVYGVPVEKRHAFHRRVSARAFRRAVSAIDGSVAPRLVTSFRALRAEATRDLGRRHGRHVSLDRLLRRSTNRFASVGVRHDPRLAGRSNYTLTMLARHAISELGRNVHVRPKTERQLSFAVSRMTPARSPARLNGRR